MRPVKELLADRMVGLRHRTAATGSGAGIIVDGHHPRIISAHRQLEAGGAAPGVCPLLHGLRLPVRGAHNPAPADSQRTFLTLAGGAIVPPVSAGSGGRHRRRSSRRAEQVSPQQTHSVIVVTDSQRPLSPLYNLRVVVRQGGLLSTAGSVSDNHRGGLPLPVVRSVFKRLGGRNRSPVAGLPANSHISLVSHWPSPSWS